MKGAILAAALFTLASAGPGAAQDPKEPPPQNPPVQQKQAAQEDQEAATNAATVKPRPGKILVPAGTRLPLVLHNSISTRGAKPGDPVYLETLFPVVIENRIVIPAGSYVSGEILEAKRPGKVKGRGELTIRLNTMILPNGYTVDFNAIPTSAGTGGNETVDEEGKVKGDSDKASDLGTVISTTGLGTGIGAGVGGLAGRGARGAGVGAIAGAGLGLLTVLMTRGPELEMPRGTSLDVLLDRPLYLDETRVQFTDPGRSSALAGPPNRQAPRRRFPY